MKKIISEFDINASNSKYLTHNFHSYPAKFVPQIPKYFIEKLTVEGDMVLDPFVGSGTTIVECCLANRRSIGVDLNPIAILSASAKASPMKDESYIVLQNFLTEIQEKVDLYYSLGVFEYQVPNFYNINHWFQKNVQYELAIVIGIANSVSDRKCKNFILSAISSIIVLVSNQESDTRYASKNKNIKDKFVTQTLTKKIKAMIPRIIEFSAMSKTEEFSLYNTDATDLSFIPDNTVDCVITSPPYANTYDYYLYHKLRMYWLGYDVENVKNNEIGSRNKHSSQKKDIDDFNNTLKRCFIEVSRVLKKDKYAVIVIGDSVIRQVLYDAKKMMIQMGKEIGFEFIDSKSENLQKTTRMFNPAFTNSAKFEHIMVFRNKK